MSERSNSTVTGEPLATALVFAVAGYAAIACWATPAVAAVPIADHGGASVLEATDATVTIEIPEVDCAGCNLDVRQAIKRAGGVRRLNEGSAKNRLIVTYEPGAGRPDVYVEALRKAGFAKAHVVA